MAGRRVRAVLLVAVWALPGAWAIGHALEHAHHHDSTATAVEATLADSALEVELDASHDHGHSHPEILSAALNGKPSTPLPVAILCDAYPVSRHGLSLHGLLERAPPRAAPWFAAVAGPRAPPIA